MSDTYETVVGLECHVELSTRTKMFCGCANEFGAEPNTLVCPVCLGHPGTLPVPNRTAVEYTMKIAMALGCDVAPRSVFHRKNYFYPDMPKNYQISQYDLPIGSGGHLDIEVDGERHRVGMNRVHLEEDTGKTVHGSASGLIADAQYALEDCNRAGVPLVEVVSEPDIRTPEQARAYLLELRALLESLGVSDVRMEEGSLRCDANISVRPLGSTEFGTKVEIKNMNSIRSVERAVRYEAERQRKALATGEKLVQETRHWDETKGETLPLRSKEYAFDYRYFPDPDLVPLEPDDEWTNQLRESLPELPAARRQRFVEEHGLAPATAKLVGTDKVWADLFEESVTLGADPRQAANWLTGDVAGLLNESKQDLGESTITAQHLADLSILLGESTISTAGAKQVLAAAFETGKSAREIVEEKGLAQISDVSALGGIVDEVIAENPGPVDQFRSGKEGVIGFLVGAVMKKSKGAANPQEAQRLLRDRLGQ
ncbi:MAG TPA: Asp-tRNA(Asn)/Glu-tRNA(Gln) amidotransferase subunit GatB [Actinomycetota bacterium]|nr:Asp-tRNA(Asn)/Glu-tRNA(Gln) amidotransferase subunit GatB [Actinomycetota bacterium]